MSISQYVALRREDLPSTSALEDAARSLGFDLRLDPTDLSTENGFIPATLDGRKAGFEWCLGPSSDHLDHAEAIGDRDVVAELVTRSDETETQSAMVCAAALLTLTRGVYFDEYGNVYTAPEPVVKEVRAWIAGELEPGAPPTGRSTERGGLHELLRRMFRR